LEFYVSIERPTPVVIRVNYYLAVIITASTQEFGPNGLIKQTKERRLFLTTDAVICVSVVPRTSDDVTSHERLSLKWFHPITEVEVNCPPVIFSTYDVKSLKIGTLLSSFWALAL
jgi:hypothetical protein